MARMGKQAYAARMFRAALVSILVVFLMLSTMLMPMAARQAYAEGAPTWTLNEVRTFTRVRDPRNVDVTVTDNSVDWRVHVKFIDGWLEEWARGGVSWNEQVSWSMPPETVDVGSEPDMWLTVEDSFSGYELDEGPRRNSTHRFYVNDFVAGTEAVGDVLIPLQKPVFYLDYFVFDPTETSIDDLFDHYVERADSGEYFSYPMSLRDDYSLSSWGDIMRFEDDWVDSYADIYTVPSYGSVSNRCHIEEAFRWGNDEEGIRSFIDYWHENVDSSIDPDKATVAMSVVARVDSQASTNQVSTVYLYTNKPGLGVNVAVDTDADENPGESGGWVIPASIVGVISVVGGSLLSRRGHGKDGDDPDPDDDQPDEEPKSTFRMQLYKEFGDTLYVGAGAETVGARIEEVTEGGVIARDDLTARITFRASTNLEAQAIGMQGHYQCVNVSALNADSPSAVVSITFAGEGGTFTNNVKFKVGKPELFFADMPLTFIAGYRQTLVMPFCFAGMRVPEDAKPTFECTLWTGVKGEGSDYFTDIEVVRDREHPEAVWNVRLTETGAKPTLEPGELERFTCEVVATWQTSQGEQKLSGIFDLYRFVEGIRLYVEPLKCYAVDRKGKFVEFRGREEGETPAEFREKLDAWREQVQDDVARYDHTIPVEYETVVSQAARSLVRVTLYTWAAGQVDDHGKFVFGPYGEEFTTLPPWDGTEGWLAIRAVNPLPDLGKTTFEFADVEGSSVLKDSEGNDVAHPSEALGFAAFLKGVDHECNEQTFHVVAAQGILTPPNRMKVDVTVRIEWGGRTFERTERVMAISQPWRSDYAEKAEAYLQADAFKRERLEYIQRKILNSSTVTWRIKGGLSLTETVGAFVDGASEKTYVEQAKDKVVEGARDYVDRIADYSVGGITDPKEKAEAEKDAKEFKKAGNRAVSLGEKAVDGSVLKYVDSVERLGRGWVKVCGSIPGQFETRSVTFTDYGDMMPLYHYIQMMLDGYDEHYGFHEPDYIRVTGAFLRRARGETGPTQAVMEALYSRDLQFADAVRITVKSWNESWIMTGLNVGCSIATAGLSDCFFIPLAAIGKGLEGAIDCIDRGGASNLEIFRSTVDAALRQVVFEVAMNRLVPKGIEWLGQGGRFAKETAEGISQHIGLEKAYQTTVRGLKSVFSSGATGNAVGKGAKEVAKRLSKADEVVTAAMKHYDDVAKKVVKGSIDDVAEGVTKVAKDSVDDVVQKTVKGSIDDVAEKAVKGSVDDVAEGATKRSVRDAAERTVKDSVDNAGSVAKRSVRDVAERTVTDSVDDVAKGSVDKVAKETFEESIDDLTGELLERDINYTLGRLEGKVKLQNLRELIKNDALTVAQRRQLIYAIQCDKHAMHALMAEPGDLGKAARKLFNKEVAEVQELAIERTHMALAEKFKVDPSEIMYVRTSGNAADDVISGIKTPMDLDATFRRYGGIDKSTGKEIWIDITEKEGQPLFDEALFYTVHGRAAASEAEAAAFKLGADHSIVSALGPESYGKYEDAMRVCLAHRAGETLEDAVTVGLTAERKCLHWQNLAKEAYLSAKVAQEAGDEALAYTYRRAAEAFVEEGGRQFTKQANRIVVERLGVLEKAGVKLDFDVQPFLNKLRLLEQCGIEKVNGLSPAEIEKRLHWQFNSSLEETYHELNELTVRLNDEIAKLNGDFVKPTAAKYV